MKKLTHLFLSLALVAGFALVAQAGDPGTEEVTLTGEVMCAKCILSKADAAACQDLLMVKDGDTATEYYLVKNDVLESFGHGCKETSFAAVTGTVAEKDGKMWLTPTRMEKTETA